MKTMRLLLSLVVAAAVVAVYVDRSQAALARLAGRPGGSASSPCVGARPPREWRHVVLLMFENQSWSGVIGATDSSGRLMAPYITNLASKCGGAYSGRAGVAASNNWHDADYDVSGHHVGSFFSKPSYAVLTSGLSPSTTGIVDDTYGTTTKVDNIYNEARRAGLSATDYYDGPASPTPCAADNFSGSYHDAIRYYSDLGAQSANSSSYCNTHDKTLSRFWSDLSAGRLPAFSMILPTNDENMHDHGNGSIEAGDRWAERFLSRLLASATYRTGNTAVFLLWDEDTPVANVLMARSVVPGSRVAAPHGAPISHFSALRTFDEMLGLPLIGDSAKAPSLLPFFDRCAKASCVGGKRN